jgi:hypothetical protein
MPRKKVLCACIYHFVYREMERQGYFEVYWTPDYEIPHFPRQTHTHTHTLTHVMAAQRGLGTAQRLSQFFTTANIPIAVLRSLTPRSMASGFLTYLRDVLLSLFG